jgi:hypothetical protein
VDFGEKGRRVLQLVRCFNGVEQEGGIPLQGLGMLLLLRSIPRCVPLLFFKNYPKFQGLRARQYFLGISASSECLPFTVFSDEAVKLKTLYSLFAMLRTHLPNFCFLFSFRALQDHSYACSDILAAVPFSL